MEIWDLYNEKRELTGREHIRGEKIPTGYFHLVVHVWIRNSKGEYLISQRSASRPAWPMQWETTGGSAVKGENSTSAAVREVKEEIGLDLISREGKLIFSEVGRVVDGIKFDDILDVWLWEYDGAVTLNRATTDEVAQAMWMNVEQIRALYDAGKLVHSLGYFFEKIEMGK